MSTSITARELVLVTLLVLVTIGHLRRAPAAQAPRRLGERAWLLVVHARFQTLADGMLRGALLRPAPAR